MAQRSARIVLLAVTTVVAQNCFWRSSGQIHALDDWYPCKNTRATAGGAQLCCLGNSQCGQDSICLKDNKYYVGGCTDGTYGDPVCRTSCTEDAQTWIQWNQNTKAWECCGNNACDGSPPTETFSAVARASWSPVQWVQQASSSTSSTSTTGSSSTPTSTSTSVSQTSTSTSATPTPTNQDEKTTGQLSTGAQAGIGVACGLIGLAAILALALFLIKKHKKRRASKPEHLQHLEPTSRGPAYSDTHDAAPMSQEYMPFGEAGAHQPQQMKQEMPAEATDPVELESEPTVGKRAK